MYLKKYSFQIRTLKNLQEPDSQIILVNFEFFAPDEKSAEDYRQSLIENYSKNQPYIPNFPWEDTKLEVI